MNLYETLSQPPAAADGTVTPRVRAEAGTVLTHSVESTDEERAGSSLQVFEP